MPQTATETKPTRDQLWEAWNRVTRRPDTSVHDAAIRAAKAEAWDEGYEFNMQLWEDGSYAQPVNPYRTASIEQTGAE